MRLSFRQIQEATRPPNAGTSRSRDQQDVGYRKQGAHLRVRVSDPTLNGEEESGRGEVSDENAGPQSDESKARGLGPDDRGDSIHDEPEATRTAQTCERIRHSMPKIGGFRACLSRRGLIGGGAEGRAVGELMPQVLHAVEIPRGSRPFRPGFRGWGRRVPPIATRGRGRGVPCGCGRGRGGARWWR